MSSSSNLNNEPALYQLNAPNKIMYTGSLDNGKFESIYSGESNNYQDLSSFPNSSLYEIHNSNINSAYDERVSLGYKYITNNIDESSGDKEEEIYNVLYEEASDSENFTSAEPPSVRPVENSNVVEVRISHIESSCEIPEELSAQRVRRKRCSDKKTHSSKKKQAMFTCDNCGFSFISSEELKEHYETSDACSKKFTCFLCSYSTNRIPTLELHLAFEHNCSELFFCYHCSHITGSKLLVEEHIKLKHIKFLTCRTCGFAARSLGQFNKHKQLKKCRQSSLTKVKNNPFNQRSMSNNFNTNSKNLKSTKFDKNSGTLNSTNSVKSKYIVYACHHCNFICPSKGVVKKHITNNHLELFKKSREMLLRTCNFRKKARLNKL